METGVGKWQKKVKAGVLALAQLTAFGCGSEHDASPARTPAAGGAAVATQALEQGQALRLYAALATDPIAAVGHGVIITADGSVVEPTAELARDAQQYYIERLLNEASPAVRDEFEQVRLDLEPEVDAPREFANRAALIDWLIERVQPSDAFSISSKNKFLVYAMEPSDEAFIVDKTTARDAYIKECAEKGVPTPPDWAEDPRSTGWNDNGLLMPDFLRTSKTATVWYWVSPDPIGLCIALPRETDGRVSQLGIICQGKVSSQACFWDNQQTFTAGEPEDKTILGAFKSAGELAVKGDVCTDCHRGENVYIIHPGSALDIDRKLNGENWKFDLRTSHVRADGWVTPIVDTSWPKNPQWDKAEWDEFMQLPLNDEGEKPETSCLDCHTELGTGGRLGRLEYQYCSAVMSDALEQTMPPSDWLTTHADSVAHREYIQNKCNALTTPPKTDPVPSTDPVPATDPVP